MLVGLGFNMKSDIWSLGVTFYQMLFGRELPYD
jgi:serine/threonine protein kinase